MSNVIETGREALFHSTGFLMTKDSEAEGRSQVARSASGLVLSTPRAFMCLTTSRQCVIIISVMLLTTCILSTVRTPLAASSVALLFSPLLLWPRRRKWKQHEAALGCASFV